MGIADVIPGVSGGTIALIFNIYERLISAIKSLSVASIWQIIRCADIWNRGQKEQFVAKVKAIDAVFLTFLAAGIFSAVISLSTIIPNLVFNYTEFTFSCFLGLIIPSIFVPWKMIKEKSFFNIVFLIAGLALTVGFSYIMKEQGGHNFSNSRFSTTCLVVFFSATLAISAMILPGISGSFILMLLGQYLFVSGLIARVKVDILGGALNERKKAALTLVENFSTLEVCLLVSLFLAGCIVGIMLMSRVVHFCFKKSHDTTMAFLTGMICSSVYVLWPFKAARPHDVEPKDWLPRAANIVPEMNPVTTGSLIILLLTLVASSALIIYGRKRTSPPKEY